MKQGIHPEYVDSKIICACGNVLDSRSIKNEIHVETCSKCHPFYTGNQKGVRHFGKAEKFYEKYGAITLDKKPKTAAPASGNTESNESNESNA